MNQSNFPFGERTAATYWFFSVEPKHGRIFDMLFVDPGPGREGILKPI